MTNNEMITEVLKDGDLKRGCKTLIKDTSLADDIFNDVMYKMLTRDSKKNYDLYKRDKLKGYIFISIRNTYLDCFKGNNKYSAKSDIDISSSDLYSEYNESILKKLNKRNDNSQSEETHRRIKNIDDILQDPKYWKNIYESYHKVIFEMYYKLNSFNMIDGHRRDVNCTKLNSSTRDIERRTGMDHGSVAHIVKDVRNYIIDILKEENNFE